MPSTSGDSVSSQTFNVPFACHVSNTGRTRTCFDMPTRHTANVEREFLIANGREMILKRLIVNKRFELLSSRSCGRRSPEREKGFRERHPALRLRFQRFLAARRFDFRAGAHE